MLFENLPLRGRTPQRAVTWRSYPEGQIDSKRKYTPCTIPNYQRYTSVPKLFVSVEPGTMMQEDRDFIRTWKNVTEVSVSGGHMVTEDSPDEVGQAIVKWFSETVMLS